MRFINKNLLLIFAIMVTVPSFAQVVIPDNTMADNTTSQPEPRKKIDGIIATVGDYMILDSDIDKSFLEISSQGNSIKDISRCQMLGKLLEDKLYAHQAVQDSIVVTDEDVKQKLDEQVSYMTEQLGSMDKVVQYFKKSSEDDLRSELSEIIKMNRLASEEQRKIIDEIGITPEEVRTFFKKIPEEELPIFGAEMEVAQIVLEPKTTKEEKDRVVAQLKEIRQDVLNGSSFATKAVLYSDDKASVPTGGFYKITKKTPFVKEFKDVAFSLDDGEISEPFETSFGYHIIYLEKIRGQQLELRHILIIPKVSDQAMKDAKERAITIKGKIESKQITFADAARAESDEKETRANGGILINPKTQDTKFELTKMDPALYSMVSNLKGGEVSLPQIDQDERGQKRYKLVTVNNRIEEHRADYAKDYIKIKELALKEKQIDAIAKWSEAKIKETYIKINGEYRDCEFTNNWLKK